MRKPVISTHKQAVRAGSKEGLSDTQIWYNDRFRELYVDGLSAEEATAEAIAELDKPVNFSWSEAAIYAGAAKFVGCPERWTSVFYAAYEKAAVKHARSIAASEGLWLKAREKTPVPEGTIQRVELDARAVTPDGVREGTWKILWRSTRRRSTPTGTTFTSSSRT